MSDWARTRSMPNIYWCLCEHSNYKPVEDAVGVGYIRVPVPDATGTYLAIKDMYLPWALLGN